MRLLYIFIGIAFICELLSAYLGSRGINNLWLMLLFTMLEYVFLVMVFSHWQANVRIRKTLLISIPVFLLVGISMMVSIERMSQISSISRSIEGVLLIMIASYTLFKIQARSEMPLLRNESFWVSIAVLIYFLGTIIFFALSDLLRTLPPEVLGVVAIGYTSINVLSYVLYARGFVCQYQAQKFGSPSS